MLFVLSKVHSFEACHIDARRRITNLCALPLLLVLLAYLALVNLLAQLSDRIIHFSEYNLMTLAFLTKLSSCTESNALKWIILSDN